MFDSPVPSPAPVTRGVAKLFAREPTLREWVAEGRDNYELARAFHVPIGDVRAVIAALGLVRPYEVDIEPAAVRIIRRKCMACGTGFDAMRFRFRCDSCLDMHSTWSEGAGCSLVI